MRADVVFTTLTAILASRSAQGAHTYDQVALGLARTDGTPFRRNRADILASASPSAAGTPFNQQYRKEIRPLLGRSIAIAHKELLFMALRVAVQTSFTVFNPNDAILSFVSNLLKFVLDVTFQLVSFSHYKGLINAEFGGQRVQPNPSTKRPLLSTVVGFVVIRSLQRLSFLLACYLPYKIMTWGSSIVAEYSLLYPNQMSEGLFDRLGFEISNPVLGVSSLTIFGYFLFRLLWNFAVRMTIADKVFLWGVGTGGERGKDKGRAVTVREALTTSPRLVDRLDASFLISRLAALYIAPRIIISCLTASPLPFFAYIDILFMLASHLVFLDRIGPTNK